jgi:hypothetical protein
MCGVDLRECIWVVAACMHCQRLETLTSLHPHTVVHAAGWAAFGEALRLQRAPRGSPWYNSAIAGGKSGRRHVTIAEWCCVFVAPAGLSYALYTAYTRQSAGYGA